MVEAPVRMPDYNEPEPDVSLARGKAKDYANRHPGPADLALVVEVAKSSLSEDRQMAIYGPAGIPVYGIVNLKAHQVEVYTLLKRRGPLATASLASSRRGSPGGINSVSSFLGRKGKPISARHLGPGGMRSLGTGKHPCIFAAAAASHPHILIDCAWPNMRHRICAAGHADRASRRYYNEFRNGIG